MINPPTRPLSVEEILRIVDWQFLQSQMSPVPLPDQALNNLPTPEAVPDPNDVTNQEIPVPDTAKKKSYTTWVIVGAVPLGIGLIVWGVWANKRHQEKEKTSK